MLPRLGILDRRAGPIAGEHVVRAALVGRFAVAHRADDAELVGHAGRLRPHLAEDLAGHLGLHHAERPAILQRGVGLGVERLLLGHAARQKDMQDALGPRRPWPTGRADGFWAAWAFSQWSKSPRTKPIAPNAPTVRNSPREGADKGFPWQLHRRIGRTSCAYGMISPYDRNK